MKSSFIPNVLQNPDLIAQWNAGETLNDASLLKFKLQASLKHCSLAKYPPATPAIDDYVQFGPSDYILQYYLDPAYKYMKPYYLLTYRAYKITNVKSANWTVSIPKSLEKTGAKTKMTVLLIDALQYIGWADSCKTTCAPPIKQAVNGTVCTDYTCVGKMAGLDGPNQNEYRLLVSYPTISSVEYPNSFSTKPMTSTFNKQMVRTKIFATRWDLPPPTAARDAPEEESELVLKPFVALKAIDRQQV